MAFTNIPGANASNYTLVSGDLGKNIRVIVTATNVAGNASAAAAQVGPVTAPPSPPLNAGGTDLPVISGSTSVSSVLTTTSGVWSGTPPISYTYQWKRGATNIGSGLTTYTLVTADIGFNITCVVTATNTAGSVNATTVAVGPIISGATTGSYNKLRLGNGGLIVRYDIANDGTMVCGTDTFGGYLWDGAANEWRQLLTTSAMPASVVTEYLTAPSAYGAPTIGFDDIFIDHGNSNNVWVIYAGNIFRSIDKGVTFQSTGWARQPISLESLNGNGKNFGPYSAVDPYNSDIVYVSTSAQGLFRSTNGATATASSVTFSQITAVSAGLPLVTGNNPATRPKSGTDTTSFTLAPGLIGTTLHFASNSANFNFVSYANIFEYAKVWSQSAPAKQIIGNITAGTASTFDILVTHVIGSGVVNDWNVSLPLDNQNQGYVCGGHRVCFDKSAGSMTNPFGTGQACKNIFVHTYGIGYWKSTDAGQTWVALNATGYRDCRQMAVDGTGVLWATDDLLLYGSGTSQCNLNKYTAGAWTNNIGLPSGTGNTFWANSLSIDPVSPTHIIITQPTTPMTCLMSSDGGANWVPVGGGGNVTYATPAGEVAWTQGFFSSGLNQFGAGVACFDPTSSGKLWMGCEGVWYMTPTTGSPAVTITTQTRGIEEFVSCKCVSPGGTGGEVYLSTWDVALFWTNNFSAYPMDTGLPGSANITGLLRGHDIDWLWSNPSTVVSVITDGTGSGTFAKTFNCKTTNGGHTPADWTAFSTKPPLGASATGCTITTVTYAGTGSVGPKTSSTSTLTITVTSGTIYPGATVTGSGITGGTTVIGQLTGTTGSTGTYEVTNVQTAASTAVSGSYGKLTVGTLASAKLFTINNWLNVEGNVPEFTYFILAAISGSGGAGSTFSLSNSTPVVSQRMSIFGGTGGGHIAISSANTIVFVPPNSQNLPQITTDGGATWADIIVTGGTPISSWGAISANPGSTKTIDSDKGNGDLYLYNININGGGSQGIYRMPFGSTTFTLQASGSLFASQSNFNEQLKTSGTAGVLFFTPGQQGSVYPTNTPFYYSNNQGVTWSTVANFKQVLCFGFGAKFAGQSFQSIYAAGWYNNVYGIWMCKNFNPTTGAGTWVQIGAQFPLDMMNYPKDIDGDKVTAGKVYIFNDAGPFWGQFT